MKPILFIDVDGVLFGEYDGYFQLRPNVIGFLDWCQKHFDRRWLTCWGDRFNKVASGIYGGRAIENFGCVPWHQYDHNKAKGALTTAKDRQFYWIEDGLPDEEIEILYHAGLLGSYLWVNPYGRDELYRIKKMLAERIGVAV
jgi:hypothetical protein